MSRAGFLSLLLLGIGLRLWMVVQPELIAAGDVDVYLSDEGVVGLMATHISEGRAAPVFFYGQAYLGALEAWCVALFFLLFGVGAGAMHMATLAFSLALLGLVYKYTATAYSLTAARWAAVLVALGPMYFLEWNLKARGGFVEHLVLLFLLLVLFWRFYLAYDRRNGIGLALGLTAGIALWVNQLAAGYLVLMGVLILLRHEDRRAWDRLLVGFALGCSLLVAYNLVYPAATLRALGRKAVVLNRVPVEERDDSWVLRGVEKRIEALGQGAGKLGLVFGVPPDSGLERLGEMEGYTEAGPLVTLRRLVSFLPLLVFGVSAWACRPRRSSRGWEPMGADQLLGAMLLITFVIGYVSPRYMLAAYPLASVAAGILVSRLVGARRAWMVVGLVGVLAFNAASWADAAFRKPSGQATERAELLAFLQGEGLEHCFSAGPLYHVVFAAGETVTLAPLQKERYPPYTSMALETERFCYVFRDDQKQKRQHLALGNWLSAGGGSWSHAGVGRYNVWFDRLGGQPLTAQLLESIMKQEKVFLGENTLMKKEESSNGSH